MAAEQLTIALDANGADSGPAEVARGAALAAAGGDLRVLVFGPAAKIETTAGVEVVDAPISIAKEADPARAVRANPQSSIVRAVRAVADGRADGLVSGGSTGAALAAGLFHLKRARGVHRPALAVLVPVPGRPFLLLDCGANVEVRPEHLVQFAHMGAAFMEAVIGLERPRVALLSNGTEATKGTEDVRAAHAALTGAGGSLEFTGMVEGFAVGTGEADVIVTDGFTGNVALKTMEATSRVTREAIRTAVRSGPISTLGGLLIRGAVGRLRAQLDPEAVGGAILLGLRRPVVVGHGSFGPDGLAAAIGLARRAVDERMVERTAAALEAGGALRSAPAGSFNPG
ncbi:MAG TPA: phosphate acyltransferase PlsX [Thermoleophilaceae bacterium]|nr:phosphate acyltransferase PlsX [Thermoleophilaceae bacterium]